MPPNPPATRISEWDMRRLFNEGRFYERLLNGELVAVEHVGDAQTFGARIPTGSKSKESLYFEKTTGQQVAQVHQFEKPSGELGASRKPDPKRLYIKGVTYAIVKKNKPTPAPLSNKRINEILGKEGYAAALTYLTWLKLSVEKWWKLGVRDPILVRLGIA